MRYTLLDEAAREHHLVNRETEWAVPLTAPLRNTYRARHVAYVHPNGDTYRMRFPVPAPPPFTNPRT